MFDFKDHLIKDSSHLQEALVVLNNLGQDLTLLVIDDDLKMIGTITDGDIRRGLLKGLSMKNSIRDFTNSSFKFLHVNNYNITEIIEARKNAVTILPVINSDGILVDVVNFTKQKSYLPIDVLIMAGGEGVRLRPLTEHTPKPMLRVGEKPIIEYMVDWLIKFGVRKVHISVNYLSNVITNYFDDGSDKGLKIKYVFESFKMGTIGSVSLIHDLNHENILILNSDLITNIDFEDFYSQHISKQADMSVGCVPYEVNVPYAIMDIDEERIISFKEKPTFTYYANAGIYIIKREFLRAIPQDNYFNATDLMQHLIDLGKKVVYYPIHTYWLDVGRIEDYYKAQNDIKYVQW